MKKAYIIPLVILLLFVSVVPCLAVSPVTLTLFTPVRYNTVTYTARSVTLNCYHNAISFSGDPDPRFYISDFSRWIPAFRLYTSHIYFIYLNTTAAFAMSINTPYWSTTFNSSQRLSVPYDGMYSMGFTGGFSPDTSFIYKVNLFDLTAIYGEGNEPTAQQFLDDLSFLGVDPSVYISDGSLSVTKTSFFDPLLEFHSHLLDPFVQVANHFTDYTVFLIFAGIVVSILLLVFVTVFIIKRFTGGKT